jgi:hypothetical protein
MSLFLLAFNDQVLPRVRQRRVGDEGGLRPAWEQIARREEGERRNERDGTEDERDLRTARHVVGLVESMKLPRWRGRSS